MNNTFGVQNTNETDFSYNGSKNLSIPQKLKSSYLSQEEIELHNRNLQAYQNQQIINS